MRSRRSTTTPTKEESAWIVAVKEGPCLACKIHYERGSCPNGWSPLYGCDFHHLKSGNIRRGHLFGIGLCAWHHRGMPDFDFTASEMRRMAGPSLMDGGKCFAAAYGTDDELLALQKRIVEGLA